MHAPSPSTDVKHQKINVANSVTPNDIDVILYNVTWAICSTYHTVLKATSDAAIFGHDMLFDIT